MKLSAIVTASFITSIILTFIGVYLKITHSEGAGTSLSIGIIASVVFIAAAIYEVQTSKQIDDGEKTRWTLAFIFFSSIAGLIYMLMSRKRIASNS